MNAIAAMSLAFLLPFAACAAHAGRGDRGAPVRVVPYDQPFALGFERSVRLERGNTRARFAELLEDSRCPTGVQCIQAGRARVRLEVRRGNAAPVSIELATDDGASLASAGGVTWELQRVEPHPAAGRQRQSPRDYVLTLVAHPLRR